MEEAPLTGWKDIAAFLGSSVRTAQRFERELALPVHRTQASKGAVVRAYPSELKRWLEGRHPVAVFSLPQRPIEGPRVPSEASSGLRRLRVVVPSLIVLGVVGLGLMWWHDIARPSGRAVSPSVGVLSPPKPTSAADGLPVRLMIRPEGGPPSKVDVKSGQAADVAISRAVTLSIRPSLQEDRLFVVLHARTSGSSELPLGTIRLRRNGTARVTADRNNIDIEWVR